MAYEPTVTSPTRELLSWLTLRERSYGEAIEAWRSHCPRLTVWEDALIDGLIRVERANGTAVVALTPLGAAALEN